MYPGRCCDQNIRFLRSIPIKGTCQPVHLAVVSDLPIKRLTRATPTGQSALAAEQGSFAASIRSSLCARGENSHRKGITRRKHRPQLLGRPVTSAGQRNAAPIGVAFSASGAEWGLCLPRWSPIPGLARAGRRKLHLPAGLLRCNIGLAYQAADAGHPKRAEQARRRTRKFLRAVYFIAGCKRRELP